MENIVPNNQLPTNNDISNMNRNQYGVNLKAGPIRLNPFKRKGDDSIELSESKKMRLDNLLNQMKIHTRAIELSMKPTTTKGKSSSTKYAKTPDYITNGEMRDYQIEGLNWLITLYEQNLSGILADEMGLGKTLQTISLIGYLQLVKKVNGRFLVIVQLSTLNNWENEFKQWCPTLKVVTLHGSANARLQILQTQLKKQPYDWDVCLTTYDMCRSQYSKNGLSLFHWHHVILDEGTRIKNENTVLSHIIGLYKANHRLILTGTPLNNNLHELWALLKFLMPKMFDSSKDFESWFDEAACLANQETVVGNLHTILKPILLRRLKSEVEKNIKPKKDIDIFVDITNLQREYYRKVLKKEIDIVNGSGYVQFTRLASLFMQLRKCTNHPYLFPGAEAGPPFVNGEHIVHNSGKMIVLDKLLSKLRQQKSRVLIFSQFTRVLDLIEDYLYLRPEYKYCRLDGSVRIDDRTSSIAEFQHPHSNKFIFLLSTRAGGLGINLTAADSVIIYDSDWNPQMDLQAIARAHRIGQTKEVRVYRLIAKDTVDEKIIERANMKLKLDDIVIQSQVKSTSNASSSSSPRPSSNVQHGYMEHVLNAVRFGANLILADDSEYDGAARDILIHENVQKMIDQMFDK